MDFWTGLLIGLLLGWVIEWLIDWFYWRRRAEKETEEMIQSRVAEAETRLAMADAESETRIREVGREWQTRLGALEAENRELRYRLNNAEAVAATAAAELVSGASLEIPGAVGAATGADETVAAADEDRLGAAAAASRTASFELPPVVDDLTTLEGIGPVYAARLRVAGITSYADLAAASEEQLAAAISPDGRRHPHYNEWIEQARLAAAGDMDMLRLMQERLNVRMPHEGDNLASIQGIGERYAAALRAAGITTFAGLAAASPEQLEGIISDAGLRSTRVDGWAEEARLRSAGVRVRSKHTRAVERVRCPQDLSAVSGIGRVFEQRLYRAGIGSFWELAEMSDEDLHEVLGEQVDYGAVRASALEQATISNSIGRAWDGTEPDDFEVITGLGVVYEQRLYAAGICSYEALAAATPDQLTAICRPPRGRTPNFEVWIAEAAQHAAARETNGQ